MTTARPGSDSAINSGDTRHGDGKIAAASLGSTEI